MFIVLHVVMQATTGYPDFQGANRVIKIGRYIAKGVEACDRGENSGNSRSGACIATV
jgi:hypothetical protein